MSEASGVGAVTTPPPSKRGKKVGSYASLDSDNSDAATDNGQAKKRGGSRGAKRTSVSTATKAMAIRKSSSTEDEASKNGGAEENGDDDDDDDNSEAEEGEEYGLPSSLVAGAAASMQRLLLERLC